MRWGVAVILAAAIGGSAEAASEPCSLRAYAVGEELTIRAAASEDSVTLAAVPAEFAEAEVREEHQGWLRVASIEDAESGQMLFEGTGSTFSEYLLKERLSRAHRMLNDNAYAAWTISSIAFAAGFGDLSYFNRTFRRRYDATPSDVRQTAFERSKAQSP